MEKTARVETQAASYGLGFQHFDEGSRPVAHVKPTNSHMSVREAL